MVNEFDYPTDMIIEFMNKKYRYHPNGDYMILIYCGLLSQYEEKNEIVRLNLSSSVKYHPLLTKAYIRDHHIREYAKKRTKGVCQLCEQRAPFMIGMDNHFLRFTILKDWQMEEVIRWIIQLHYVRIAIEKCIF